MADEVPESENTEVTITKDGSQVFGISLRGWIAIIITLSVCYMAIMQIAVTEPLYTLATVVISFYFGHQMGQANKKSP